MAAFTRATRQSVQVVMLAVGAYLVITGEATPGVMVATTILLGRALAPIEQVVGSWRVLAEGRLAFRRLRESLESSDSRPERMSLAAPSGRLVAQNLLYRPPQSEKLILGGVSLSLEPGESLAIIGPSSAGKSTLVRLLTDVWKPNAGMVRLEAEHAMAQAVAYPPDIADAAKSDPRLAELLVKERSLFNARREAFVGQVSPLKSVRMKPKARVDLSTLVVAYLFAVLPGCATVSDNQAVMESKSSNRNFGNRKIAILPVKTQISLAPDSVLSLRNEINKRLGNGLQRKLSSASITDIPSVADQLNQKARCQPAPFMTVV